MSVPNAVQNPPAQHQDRRFEGRATDIIIFVMGTTGAGRSTFINSFFTEEKMKVANAGCLASCTLTLDAVEIPQGLCKARSIPKLNRRRLILVDTPGFDLYDSMSQAAGEYQQRISSWLDSSYWKEMKIHGVIYLYDLSQQLNESQTKRNLTTVEKLVHLRKVVVGATNIRQLEQSNVHARNAELSSSGIFKGVAKIMRVESPPTSPQVLLINEILKHIEPNLPRPKVEERNPKKRRRAAKFLRLMAQPGDSALEGRPDDIIIPVMGPTGAGKSTFINSLLSEGQPLMKVGHGCQSCTSDLVPVEIQVPFANDLFQLILGESDAARRRLIIVDTPGFDDTFLDDSEILRRISVWLAKSYNDNMKIAGVIYLHDITQTRMLGTTRRNLDLFKKLIGEDARKSLILGTTKWGMVETELALKRQSVLQLYWADLLEAGAKVIPVKNMKSDPLQIIGCILQRPGLWTNQLLMIQKEIVDMKKFIPETEAGKTLKFSLDDVIREQKTKADKLATQVVSGSDDPKLRKEFEEGQNRLKDLLHAAKDMKIPFSARLKRFFL